MSKVPLGGSLFERLHAGLDEGIQFVRGGLDLRTTLVKERSPNLPARDRNPRSGETHEPAPSQ